MNVVLDFRNVGHPVKTILSEYVQGELKGKGFNPSHYLNMGTGDFVYCCDSAPKNGKIIYTDSASHYDSLYDDGQSKFFTHNQLEEFIAAVIGLFEPKEIETEIMGVDVIINAQGIVLDEFALLNKVMQKARKIQREKFH